MQENNPTPQVNNTRYVEDDDEIDIRALLMHFWHDRRLILMGVLATIVLGFLANEYLARYRSEGFFAVSGINPVSYKKIQSIILNPENFEAYSEEIKLSDENIRKNLHGLFSSKAENFNKSVNMISSITPKDAKDFILEKEKNTADFIGMTINISNKDPVVARDINFATSRYLVDALMLQELSGWVRGAVSSRDGEVTALKQQLILAKRSVEESGKKLEGLRQIIKRIPEAATMHTRQVLSVDNGAEKYMSPVAQMVVAESTIVDAQLALQTLQRKQKQLDQAYLFYKPAAEIVEKSASGVKLFAALVELRAKVFQNTNLNDEVLAEVVNNVDLQIEAIKKRYFQDFRYISGPTLPAKPEKKGVLLVILGAGGIGFVLMLLLSLVLAWWRQGAQTDALV